MKLNERGFSLLELLTVLLIIAIFAGLAFPLLNPVLDKIRLKGDAQRMAAVLRSARQEAISTGKPSSIYFYPFGGYYQVRGGSTYVLQEGVEFDGTTSFGSAYPSGPPACIFSTTGAPQPRAGTVVLTNKHNDRLYVIVNPVIGRVRVSETAPQSWSE